MDWIITALAWIGGPILVYVVVRFGSAAYFKSKSDFLKGEKGYGIREEER